MSHVLRASLVVAVFSFLEITIAKAVPRTHQGVSKWSPHDPVVTIINISSHDKAYDVETSSAAPNSAFPSCTGCITVAAGQTVKFHPGPFIGALTANHHTGTRHEFNFFSNPGSSWYDDDMQYGMSDETLGPSDHSSQIRGEKDTLGKANAAWAHTDSTKKKALLHSGYFAGNNGKLTMVRMDASAPELVINWLQMDADFNAYIGAGSVEGKVATEVDKKADKNTTFCKTNKMTITVHK
ncbi:hypothetical protein MMC29_006903 [Sticta canariensis]|nr:hypothetical protein [Sticta canariensis]